MEAAKAAGLQQRRGEGAEAKRCVRSSVVLFLRRVVLRARACSCCRLRRRQLNRSQRCATRSVATIEWCGPGEQQALRVYAENAVLWANRQASAAAPEFF